MPHTNLSKELDAQAQAAADRLGYTKDDFIAEAIADKLDEEEAPLSAAQMDDLKARVSQLDRGEVMTSEEVDVFF